MSRLLRSVRIAWFIFCTVNVFIDSAPPPGPGPPGGSPPTNASIPLSDPLCPDQQQDPCPKGSGRRMVPNPYNCSTYFECDGNSPAKPQSCGVLQLFSKIDLQCILTNDTSICLQCPPTATSRSTDTTRESKASSSTTTTSTTKASTTTASTTTASTIRPSTISRSPTPNSEAQESTTPTSTTNGSTTSSSAAQGSDATNSAAASSDTSAIRAEITISTTEPALLSTSANHTETSETTSTQRTTSVHSSDGMERINTTSTVDAAISSSTTDAGSVYPENTATESSASYTRESATNMPGDTSSNSNGGIQEETTETDLILDSSTSTVPAVVQSNNTVPTASIPTSSTTSMASTSSAKDSETTLKTPSSASSETTLKPSSSTASLAAPSSVSSTSGKPDGMTSSSSIVTSSIPTLPIFRREILFTAASPGIVSEGTNLAFECAFIWQTTDYGDARIDEFIWILNGNQLESTGRIVIIQPTTKSSDNFWKSTVSFKPALSQDSGNLTCCATTSGFINATYQLFEVLPKPLVTLTPHVTTVREGEGALLICSVNVTLNRNLTTGNIRRLMWLKNGHVSQDEEYPARLASSSTQLKVSTLNLTSLESDVNVTCVVETSFVNVSSTEAIVRVVKLGLRDPSCPSETVDGVNWAVTAPGSYAIQSCPNGGSGLSRRNCRVDSTWELPDLDRCIATKYTDLQNEVNGVRDRNEIMDNSIMARLAEEIAAAINNAQNMTSAELETAVQIVSNMSEIHSGSPITTIGPEELTAMMQAIDHLLNVSSWERVSQNLAVFLLTTINVFSEMYAKQEQNQAIFIVNKNLVYESDGMSSARTMSPVDADIHFPDWTKVDGTTEDGGLWANSIDDVINMKRQTAFKLLQSSISSSSSLNFSSSCIRNLGKYLPLTEYQKRNGCYINSNVISLTFVEPDMSTAVLDQPFVISAEHLKPEPNKSMTGGCVFWNFSATSTDNESWEESGCTTISSNETHTSCSCSHLTNFAILMSPTAVDAKNEVILSIISMVGCIVSIIALALTILLYLTQWKKMKSKRAGVLINLCIALGIANIIFLAGSDKTQPEVGCTVVAALLHYFFLAAFFMMLLEGVMLVIYVIFVFYALRLAHTVAMIIAAWLIPAVIVGISLGVTKTKGYGTKTTCWLSVEQNVLWAFVAPALFIIFVNLMIIVIVLSRIARTKVRSDLKKKRNKLLSIVRNIVILSPIMGVTWIFGVLSVSAQTVAFQYIFAITNSLQGVFIFILHGLCHAKNTKSSSSSKPKSRRLTGVLTRSSAPRVPVPLSGTDSQEDLVQPTKPERDLYAEEVLSKENSVHKVFFGQQLSNTSNGTALTMLSNNSSTNGRTSSTIVSGVRN